MRIRMAAFSSQSHFHREKLPIPEPEKAFVSIRFGHSIFKVGAGITGLSQGAAQYPVGFEKTLRLHHGYN
jgi:hypothetical protein